MLSRSRILRRLLILAGEGIGLVDPNAIGVVTACANALQYVGLPEAKLPLALAAAAEVELHDKVEIPPRRVKMSQPRRLTTRLREDGGMTRRNVLPAPGLGCMIIDNGAPPSRDWRE